MRIAIATDLNALGRGGLEALVRELVSGLAPLHEIVLVSADHPSEIKKSHIGGLILRHIQVPANYASQEWILQFTTALQGYGVEICHFHLTGTYGWRSGISHLCPIPHVAASGIRCFTTNHQAIHPFDLSTTEYSTLRRLLGYVRRLPPKTTCINAVEREFLVSDHDHRIACRWFPHVAHKFGRIYHSCLDTTSIPTGLPESRVILNLGTVCFRKGQHVLANAFARIAKQFPEWKLRFVGQLAEQACIDEIRACAEASGLEGRIELCGPNDDPVSDILKAEIYVQPSLLEGLGLSLQEAMFHGRSCIGSRVGGIPELLDHNQSGLLVPPNKPDELAAGMAQLMQSRSLRVELASSARHAIAAKGMTREAMIAQYGKLYTASC